MMQNIEISKGKNNKVMAVLVEEASVCSEKNTKLYRSIIDGTKIMVAIALDTRAKIGESQR